MEIIITVFSYFILLGCGFVMLLIMASIIREYFGSILGASIAFIGAISLLLYSKEIVLFIRGIVF